MLRLRAAIWPLFLLVLIGVGGSPALAAPGVTLVSSAPAIVAAGGATTVSYTLSEPATVRLEVLDGAGTVVRTVNVGSQAAGAQSAAWDGKQDDGTAAPDGSYTLRVVAEGGQAYVWDTAWGSNGIGNGQFSTIKDVAVAPTGDVYVVDSGGTGRVQRFSSTGAFLNSFNSGASNGDSVRLAVDGAGNVYVASYANKWVKKFSPTGTALMTVYSTTNNYYYSPTDVAVDGNGNIYVLLYKQSLRKYNASGTLLNSWAPFSCLQHSLAVDSGGAVYVTGNDYDAPSDTCLDYYETKVLNNSGTYLRKFSLDNIEGMTLDPGDALFVANNPANTWTRRASSDGTVLDTVGSAGTGNGQFNTTASGIGVDTNGNVYVGDPGNARVQKWRKDVATGSGTTTVVVDSKAPTIGAPVADKTVFNPQKGDQVTITSTVTDDRTGVSSWTATINDPNNTLIKAYNGSGGSVSFTWDGRNGSTGQVVPPGKYTVKLAATDAAGNLADPPLEITVDTTAPTITGPTVTPAAFSPNGDGVKDTTSITATFSEPVTYGVYIKNAGGTVIHQWRSAPNWTLVNAPNQPSARSGQAMATGGDGNVYLFGGNGDGTTLDDTWKFDPVAKTWTLLTPTNKPLPRYGHAMATDGNGKVYLFGGDGTTGLLSDTWVFDPATGAWTQINPANSPSARRYHRMAGASDGKIYLFGGYGSLPRLDDLWVFDPAANGGVGDWTQVTTVIKPGGRYGHAMASANNGKLYVFGGLVLSDLWGEVLGNDTWAFDLTTQTWAQVGTGSAPDARVHADMSVGNDGRLYLFGGERYGCCGAIQVWGAAVLNPATNTWASLTTTDRPADRSRLAMAFADKVYLFGGWGTSGALGDTWSFSTLHDTATVTWDGAQGYWSGYSWISGAAPDGRYTVEVVATDTAGNSATASASVDVDTAKPMLKVSAAPLVRNSAGAVTITVTSHEALNAAPSVTVTAPGGAPQAITMTAAGSNTWTGTHNVTAGATNGAYRINATGADLAGNAGSADSGFTVAIDTTVPAINGPTATPDPFSPNGDGVKDTTTITGSFSEPVNWFVKIKDSTGSVVKQWQNTEKWSQVNPSGKPSVRRWSAMARGKDGRVYLFGGDEGVANGGVSLNDTWAFDPSTGNWTRLFPANAPSARYGHAMATGSDGKIYLFGGYIGNYTGANDTWVFDPVVGTWTQLNPANKPVARMGHGLAAGGDGKLYLFGGYQVSTYSPAYLNDTWVFDPATGAWTPLSPATKPSVRGEFAMAGLVDGKIYLFGGSMNTDTWVFDPAAQAWTQLVPATSPSKRDSFAAAGTSKLYVFGGRIQATGQYTQDLWAFDPGSGTWTQVAAGSGPSARRYATMAPAGNGQVYLFGGDSGPYLNDTWALSDKEMSISQSWDGTHTGGSVVNDGTYTVEVTGTDAGGHTVTGTGSVVLDKTAPTLTVTAAPGTVATPQGVTITVTANEPLGGVPTVTVTPAGGTATPVAMTAAGANTWTGTYTVAAGAASSAYNVSGSGTDVAGNQGNGTGAFTVSLDATAPTFTTTSSAQYVKPGDTVNVTITASEPLSAAPAVSVTGQALTVSTSGDGWSVPVTVPVGTPDGPVTVSIEGTDQAGNAGSGSASFVVDGTPPNIGAVNLSKAAFSPLRGSVTATTTVTDAGSGVAAWRVVVTTAGGVEVRRFDGTGGGVSQAWDGMDRTSARVPDGRYAIKAEAWDNAGNYADPPGEIIVDTVAPTITSQTPADGATVASVAEISAVASDALSGINAATIVLKLDSTVVAHVYDATTGKVSYTPASLADGVHTVQLDVSDQAGNPATATWSFTVDTGPPTLTVTASPATATFPGDVTITVTASEGLQATPSLTLTPPGGTAQPVTITSAGTNTWAGTYTITGASANGTYSLSASGTDVAGNQGTGTGSFTVALDSTGPTITPVAPTDGATVAAPRPAIEATVSDPSGVDAATVALTLDGIARPAAFDPAMGQLTYTPSADLANGAHAVTVVAKDTYGNQLTATWSFTVDITPPTLTATASPAWVKPGGVVTVTISSDQTLQSLTVGGTPQAASGAGPWTISYTVPAGTPDGPLAVAVTGQNLLGVGGSGAATVNVDGTAPVIGAVTASPRFINPNVPGRDRTTITAPLSDGTGSGIVSWSWTLCRDSACGQMILSTTNSGATVNVTWAGRDASGAVVADGRYYIKISATDAVGNLADPPGDVIVDTTAPTFSGLVPGDGATVNQRRPLIGATVSDGPDGSGVDPASIVLTVDGQAVAYTYDAATGTVSFTPGSDLADGPHTVRLTAADNLTNAGSVTWSFTVDATAPGGGGGGAPEKVLVQALINNGALTTQRREVALNIDATPSVSEMLVSEREDFAGAAWEPYAAVKAWTLSEGDGARTVYVKVRTASGLEAGDRDWIVLDTKNPTVFADPAGKEIAAPIQVRLVMDEPGLIYYTTDGTVPTEASGLYTGPVTVRSGTTLKFFGLDRAKNRSVVATEQYPAAKAAAPAPAPAPAPIPRPEPPKTMDGLLSAEFYESCGQGCARLKVTDKAPDLVDTKAYFTARVDQAGRKLASVPVAGGQVTRIEAPPGWHLSGIKLVAGFGAPRAYVLQHLADGRTVRTPAATYFTDEKGFMTLGWGATNQLVAVEVLVEGYPWADESGVWVQAVYLTDKARAWQATQARKVTFGFDRPPRHEEFYGLPWSPPAGFE